MNLPDIQTNLQTVIAAITELSGQLVLVDDGAQDTAMEAALGSENCSGLVILILIPQAIGADRARGGVSILYTTTVWVRTNPKVKDNDVTRWNPLTIEGLIIAAVLQWSKTRNDLGFTLTPDMEPESDWTDVGNNSRLIRFATKVLFQ